MLEKKLTTIFKNFFNYLKLYRLYKFEHIKFIRLLNILKIFDSSKITSFNCNYTKLHSYKQWYLKIRKLFAFKIFRNTN